MQFYCLWECHCYQFSEWDIISQDGLWGLKHVSGPNNLFVRQQQSGGSMRPPWALFQSETTTSRMNSEAFMGAGCWRNCKMWGNPPTLLGRQAHWKRKAATWPTVQNRDPSSQGSFFFQLIVFGVVPYIVNTLRWIIGTVLSLIYFHKFPLI